MVMAEKLKSYRANGGKWSTLQTDLGVTRPSIGRWMSGKPMSKPYSKLFEYYFASQANMTPLPEVDEQGNPMVV